WLEVRSGARRALRSFDRVRLYVGTAEVMARAVVLGERKEIERKDGGLCQLALDDEIVVANGDRFVIRSEEATRTTGGGGVLHPLGFGQRGTGSEPQRWLLDLREGSLTERCRGFLELLREFAAPAEFVAQALSCTAEELRSRASRVAQLIALPSDADPQAF